MKNMDTEKFGKFIAACRMDNHMTQKELAQKLQVTDKAVSRWESGKGLPDISLSLIHILEEQIEKMTAFNIAQIDIEVRGIN